MPQAAAVVNVTAYRPGIGRVGAIDVIVGSEVSLPIITDAAIAVTRCAGGSFRPRVGVMLWRLLLLVSANSESERNLHLCVTNCLDFTCSNLAVDVTSFTGATNEEWSLEFENYERGSFILSLQAQHLKHCL